MFHGILTNLVTPFDDTGIDEERFAAFAAWQVAERVDGLVTCTIAGEGPTLLPDERYRATRVAVEAAAGRVPVLAATGTNCTAATVELTRAAKAAGAAAALLVTPYYSKPSQEGMYRHVEAVARAVDLPLIVHNVPSRTNVDLAPVTIERLSKLPAVVGLLDETADSRRLGEHAAACGRGMIRMAAGEMAPLPLRAPPPGACLSVAANIAPSLCRAAWHEGSEAGMASLDMLYRALDHEPEPVAAKYALSLLWPDFDPRPRLPLTPAGHDTEAIVRVMLSRLAAGLDPMPAGRIPVPAIGRPVALA